MKPMGFRCIKCNYQGAFRRFSPTTRGPDEYNTRCPKCHHVRAIKCIETLPRFQRPLGDDNDN